MPTTLEQLAQACDAEILTGDADLRIDAAANIDDAGPHALAFLCSAARLDKLATTSAGAVVVPRGTPAEAAPAATALLAVADPEIAFIRCLRRLYPDRAPSGTVSAKAEIDASATIGAGSCIEAFTSIGAGAALGRDCHIHAGCWIGAGVRLGDRCVLHPNVVLYDGVTLGNDVVIHAGSVIGADGYGYKFRDGEHVKFPQVGTVEIGDKVEIGANTCIDRAALGATRIGAGTKIDNQVHIAHNVQIGRGVLLCGQVGIGGSSVIGDYAVLASQCGIADHVTVGERATVLAQAGVTKDVGARGQVMGFPAADRKAALREMAALGRLAAEQRAIEELVRLLPRLRGALGGSDPADADLAAD
jgi:UDP-3-O-[3-hydroxymyristoyl] glucosamine N-acyltransferase